jgi:DNA polymerase V
MELTDLWGVAGRLALRLAALGIANPLALRDADPRFVRGHFSVVLERMVYELRGVPCLGLEEVTPDRKSIMASRSFGRVIETRDELQEAVAVYVARAAEKMRRQKLATANLMGFVTTNPFKPSDPQYAASKSVQLPVATADTGKLIRGGRGGARRSVPARLPLQESRRDAARPGAGRQGAGGAVQRAGQS